MIRSAGRNKIFKFALRDALIDPSIEGCSQKSMSELQGVGGRFASRNRRVGRLEVAAKYVDIHERVARVWDLIQPYLDVLGFRGP